MTKRAALVLLEDSPSGASRKFARAAVDLELHPVILFQGSDRVSSMIADGIDAVQADTSHISAVIDACEQLCRSFEIVGVTTPLERLYATAASACLHLGLPGPRPDQIEHCRNKFVQRERLTMAGIATPAYHLVKDAAAARRWASEIGLPVVVKPVIGTSSTGVKLCCQLSEVGSHAELLLTGEPEVPPSPAVLVEEFAKGQQYCVNTIGSEIAGISAEEFGDLPHFALRGFTFPAPLASKDCERLGTAAVASLQALGLGWGPANTEVRITARGPLIIEVNPRISGVPDPEMIRLAHGIDLFTETLKLFLGLQPNLAKRHSRAAAASFLMVEKDGVLRRIHGLQEARAVPGVVEVELTAELGTTLVKHGDFRDVLGLVIAASPSLDQARSALQRALSLIQLSVAAD
ncbi:ATP-grasp domain-containing protein [Mesorhizobium sp. M0317]|uniref:ATP-grasp domain-containing protein n=1 Tax=Mesorhizobium sp. M0317 TaxID=2956935 RepID=UPI00333515FC